MRKGLAILLILAVCLPAAAVAEGLTDAERSVIESAAACLRGIGFEFSDELLEEHIGQMEAWKTHQASFKLSPEWHDYEQRRRLDETEQASELLTFLGMGRFDDETFRCEPISDQVYAFDDEVMWVDTMYEDFLTGVSGIIPDIQIAGIQEYLTEMTRDGGGRRTVFFTCDGQVFHYTLTSWSDWLNLDIVARLNDTLAELGYEGRLHIVSMEDQIVTLIYGTDDWAEAVCGAIGTEDYEISAGSVFSFFNLFP